MFGGWELLCCLDVRPSECGAGRLIRPSCTIYMCYTHGVCVAGVVLYSKRRGRGLFYSGRHGVTLGCHSSLVWLNDRCYCFTGQSAVAAAATSSDVLWSVGRGCPRVKPFILDAQQNPKATDLVQQV